MTDFLDTKDIFLMSMSTAVRRNSDGNSWVIHVLYDIPTSVESAFINLSVNPNQLDPLAKIRKGPTFKKILF